MQIGNLLISYTMEKCNRILQANLLAVVTDAEGFRETYAYDAEDRLCRMWDRTGDHVHL